LYREVLASRTGGARNNLGGHRAIKSHVGAWAYFRLDNRWCSPCLESYRTRAESVTLHASESSIGGATGSTTRNSTSTRRRPSGPDTHAQQPSGSQVSFRPEMPGHHQRHQPNGPPDPMGEVGVRNEGSSSSNERVTPASHPNAAPAHEEHKSSGRWKRFLKRCKTIFLKGVRPTSRLSCKSAKGGMSM
jgi:hypothetical protein